MSSVTSLPPPPPTLQSSNVYNTLLNNKELYNNANNGGEEISTIFVVGFPDDMQEREFQNMFIFSPGFEAATLKIPSKDAEDDATSNSNGNNSARRQIIGFAKFRTRHEALEAKDILSGRKVDAEKGSVLKAEMAKKNLHTKRGLSSDQTQKQQPKRFPQPTQSAFEAFYSVPYNSSNDMDLYASTDYFMPNGPLSPPPFSDPVFAPRPSLEGRAGSMGDIRFANNYYPRYSSKSILELDNADLLSKSTPSPLFTPPNNSSNSAANGLSSVLEEAYGTQPSPPLPKHSLSTSSLQHQDLTSINARLGGLSINTSAPAGNNGLPSPPGMTSPTAYRSLFGTLANNSNMNDQSNPPCNTLYVGNLPPNTQEEELRAMFSRCVGYKRLSLRSKVNGPMCFVEFEDVACATQALAELNGSPLSNSVKGGIRLSFSKNPLGVRQNSITSANFGF